MSVHSRVAVHQAARIASQPYRRSFNRGNIHAQETTVITKVIQTIKRVFTALQIWKNPSAPRTVRRSIKSSSVANAKNKDDPHLEKRV